VKNRAETLSTLILKLNRVLSFSYVDPTLPSREEIEIALIQLRPSC
jgi:hypothetical protein